MTNTVKNTNADSKGGGAIYIAKNATTKITGGEFFNNRNEGTTRFGKKIISSFANNKTYRI